ncbi:hypothetical protein ACFLXE_08935, partial [Chloroflexota bacterium]
DSELNIAILDSNVEPGMINGHNTTVCRFAKQLRMSLWVEHLGITTPDLIDDPIDISTGLPAQWPDWRVSSPASPLQKHHAVCHYVPEPSWMWPGCIPNRFMNTKTVDRQHKWDTLTTAPLKSGPGNTQYLGILDCTPNLLRRQFVFSAV